MGHFKIVEGWVKYRVGKRWKQRWCILQKLSPVSNCVHVCLHKGGQPRSSQSEQASAVYPLEDFCGIDAPFQWDHEHHVMAVICRQRVLVLSLANKSTLDAWCLAIRTQLGCDHRFLVEIVKAPLRLKHNTAALLFVHGSTLCLTSRCSGQPAGPLTVFASWTVFDLQRYGVLDSKFCFQVTGVDGSNVYVLSSVSATQIDRLMHDAATRNPSASISSDSRTDCQWAGEDEQQAYHRRSSSSHAGSRSLDSSSIYALLSFDLPPKSQHVDCVTDSPTVLVERLRPVSYEPSQCVKNYIKYESKKEAKKESNRVSVTGSLVSAVPNLYTDSVSSKAMKQKLLVVSLAKKHSSKPVQCETSDDRSLHISVTDTDNSSSCSRLASSSHRPETDGDQTQNSDNVALRNDQSESCPDVAHVRRYSCGDQLAATWWRFLDHATSFSDLRALPRSLSRFCCSTWRTFTGVKSPCIDVSKVDDAHQVRSCENSRLNVNGVRTCVGHRAADHAVNARWQNPTSPDRRRLLEVGSDVEYSSLCADSPNKMNFNHEASLESSQKLSEAVSDGEMSDSDGAGSYVSLRVNYNSIHCNGMTSPASVGDKVPISCHSDCDNADEDEDLVFSAGDISPEQTASRQKQSVTTHVHDFCVAVSSDSSSSSSLLAASSPTGNSAKSGAVQNTMSDSAFESCQSFTRSSSAACDQLLHASNHGYVNLSAGMLSHRSGQQAAPTSTQCVYEQPAKITTDTNLVPTADADFTMPTVRPRGPSDIARLSLDNEIASDKLPSWKSSNPFLCFIKRSPIKSKKRIELSSATGTMESSNLSSDLAAHSGAVNISSCRNNRRLPSPDGPPPPVPDDCATSRLFQLCNSSSVADRLPASVSHDYDPQYQVMSSYAKSLPATKKSSSLSSSYSAGDRHRSQKASVPDAATANTRLLPITSAHRHKHVRQSSVELVYRPRYGSDRSEAVSVQSSASDGCSAAVHWSPGDSVARHGGTSVTTTSLRPRYGAEYQRIDRYRRAVTGCDLVDDCSTASSTPQQSPYSVASSSVFTFDSFSVDGDDVPPPLPVRTRRSEPTYINLTSHSRTTSDSRPTAVPVEVNYAEIDLTGLATSRSRPAKRDDVEPTPYAVIDLEATAAAARTGREHARLREDRLPARLQVRRPIRTHTKASTLGKSSRSSTVSRKSSMPANYYDAPLFDITRWSSMLPNEGYADSNR